MKIALDEFLERVTSVCNHLIVHQSSCMYSWGALNARIVK